MTPTLAQACKLLQHITTHGRAAVRRAMAQHFDSWQGIEALPANGSEADVALVADQFVHREIDFALCEALAQRAQSELIPQQLAQIPDAPLMLTYQGNQALLNRPAVAIVGARRCSIAGREFAYALGKALADEGIVVVSGLARGIDAAAHRGALLGAQSQGQTTAPQGRTIAVMGRGLAQTYPTTHEKLAREIIKNKGLLVSEYLPTAPPYASNFPERNRLISGLAMGVVVVEATLRSGSLITARLALEQGRDVMAVPGPVGQPISAGCHRLIQQGAALVTTPLEVLQTIGVDVAPPLNDVEQRNSPAAHEAAVLAAMPDIPVSVDRLAHALGQPSTTLVCTLVELEIKGFVRQLAQGYIRTPFKNL